MVKILEAAGLAARQDTGRPERRRNVTASWLETRTGPFVTHFGVLQEVAIITVEWHELEISR